MHLLWDHYLRLGEIALPNFERTAIFLGGTRTKSLLLNCDSLCPPQILAARG